MSMLCLRYSRATAANCLFLVSQLRKLNLPSTLEALERPIGLPPSLLRKAEEVRLEDGPAKIQAALDDVERLAEQDESILEEVLLFETLRICYIDSKISCRQWTS